MLFEAYGEEAVCKSSVLEWHKGFKEGRENMGDCGVEIVALLICVCFYVSSGKRVIGFQSNKTVSNFVGN
jgi:hypothetical protein